MRRLAVDLVLRLAHPVRERLVDERVFERAVEVGDRAGNVVGEQPQLDFLRLQRVADADVVLDVGHHRECAGDPGADLAVGEQRDAHPAQLAARLAVAPLVGDGRARERALDVALHLGRSLAGEHVAQHAAEEVVGRDADPVAERLVGEAHLELPVEIEDRRSDAVGDEAQPVLALPRLELQPLQVVDVGIRREVAAHEAVCAAVGVVVDADPDRRTAGRGELALEIRALAGDRRLYVGVVELVDVAADDFDDFAAEDVLGALAGPVEERLVDEAVALVAVDVGERQPERVELALRQREQDLAIEDVADRLLDRRELGAVQRSRGGHVGSGETGKRDGNARGARAWARAPPKRRPDGAKRPADLCTLILLRASKDQARDYSDCS